MTKRDSENRGDLGHWVAESNEDRFLEHLSSDSAALTRSVQRMGFGVSGLDASGGYLISLSFRAFRCQTRDPPWVLVRSQWDAVAHRAGQGSVLKGSPTGGKARRSEGWHASSLTRPAAPFPPQLPHVRLWDECGAP